MPKLISTRCLLILLVLLVSGGSWGFAGEAWFRDGSGEWHPRAAMDVPSMPKSLKREKIGGGGINFSVTYDEVTTNSNSGFDDPVEGPARRAVMDAVLAYVNQILDESGTCDIRVTVSQFDGDGFLAQAGPGFFEEQGVSNGFAFDHIVSNIDPLPGDYDIDVTVDFGYTWHTDLMTEPDSGKYDLYSVLLHEITHGLGFLSLIGSSGNSYVNGTLTQWDNLLYRAGEVKLWDSIPPPAIDSNYLIQPLWFHGFLASAVFNGRPTVYSPDPFRSGSSLSHWSEAVNDADAVMLPTIADGQNKRNYLPFEIGALADLGYQLNLSPLNSVDAWAVYEYPDLSAPTGK